mmetsp:Transcript_85960/g.232963  ORF Transcript_85960/g.232963 Transcript_85960/m.232963 type:complete len:163 (+) Transcript_85960:100-588(+)
MAAASAALRRAALAAAALALSARGQGLPGFDRPAWATVCRGGACAVESWPLRDAVDEHPRKGEGLHLVQTQMRLKRGRVSQISPGNGDPASADAAADPFSSMEAFDDDELAATSADVSLAQRGFVVQKSKGPVTPEHGVLRADGIEDDEEALGLLDAFDLQA